MSKKYRPGIYLEAPRWSCCLKNEHRNVAYALLFRTVAQDLALILPRAFVNNVPFLSANNVPFLIANTCVLRVMSHSRSFANNVPFTVANNAQSDKGHYLRTIGRGALLAGANATLFTNALHSIPNAADPARRFKIQVRMQHLLFIICCSFFRQQLQRDVSKYSCIYTCATFFAHYTRRPEKRPLRGARGKRLTSPLSAL